MYGKGKSQSFKVGVVTELKIAPFSEERLEGVVTVLGESAVLAICEILDLDVRMQFPDVPISSGSRLQAQVVLIIANSPSTHETNFGIEISPNVCKQSLGIPVVVVPPTGNFGLNVLALKAWSLSGGHEGIDVELLLKQHVGVKSVGAVVVSRLPSRPVNKDGANI